VARAEAYLQARFILIRPTVWPQYTNVTDRHDRTQRDRQDMRTDNGLIAQGEPFYKRSPKNAKCDSFRSEKCQLANLVANRDWLTARQTGCCVHFPVILSNYNGTTAYICRRFVPTTAFLIFQYVIYSRSAESYSLRNVECDCVVVVVVVVVVALHSHCSE